MIYRKNQVMGAGKLRSMFYGLIAMVIAAGCSEVKETEKADLQFWLTDMPGEYQQVNIDVQQVNVILNDSLIELATNQGIYNLLDFVNGKDTLIVDDEVTSGFLSQIQMLSEDDRKTGLKIVLSLYMRPEEYYYPRDVDPQTNLTQN